MSPMINSKTAASYAKIGGETATTVQNSLQLERLQFAPSSLPILRESRFHVSLFHRLQLKFFKRKEIVHLHTHPE